MSGSAVVAAIAICPLQWLMASPLLLFLTALVLMLFRPPNLGLFPVDRIAFCLLIFVMAIRSLLLRSEAPFVLLSVPMLGLITLALAGQWTEPFDAEAWSLVAAKFIVPFAMFHLAGLVFADATAVRKLEIFCLVILGYLCFISIAFLAGATDLIFPRFILDSGIETHAERARGPFLQAAANGIALNMLGLLAWSSYQQRRVPLAVAVPLLIALPFAIFATMTRAVWLSFTLSAVALVCATRRNRWRNLLLCAAVGALLSSSYMLVTSRSRGDFQDRFEDPATIEFRLAVYQLGWEMVKEKPVLGWGQGQFAREIAARISGYRQENYATHNTFLEILVEHGWIGMLLYAWMAISLFRLRKRSTWLGFAWPVCLGVYFLNACFVVMNYQFVNALLFTFAGILAFQKRAFFSDADTRRL